MNLNVKNFNFSVKNIPIPSQNAYKKRLLEMTESLLRRMRMKAYFYNKESSDQRSQPVSNFGFKSDYAPPKNEHLNAFEEDIYEMVRNIEFTKCHSPFLKSLNEEVNTIKRSPNLFISADKTSNIYEMKKEDYNKLLKENVTKGYKKTKDEVVNKINKKAKKIACSLNLDKKVQCYADRPAFLYIKDHKENFPAVVKCRLINPAKSEIGKISKIILDRVNSVVREKTKVLQWRNTHSVIEWFKGIKNKRQCKFLKFDIAEFYPSISKKVLKKSIKFAREFTEVSEEEEEIIIHAKEALLFSNDSAWVKKSKGAQNFDVTMGSYDGSETAEIIGLYILNKLSSIFGVQNIGLYRDDGLAVLENASGPEMERASKKLIKIFKDDEFTITADSNLKGTDFLDVYLDLKSGRYKPYHKPNDVPIYVHSESNHPPTITKRMPEMIEQRVSKISCDEKEFKKSKKYYENTLEKSGYKEKLSYVAPTKKNQKRKRKIIWFNPPYSKNVRTNVGKLFLSLVKKHFPPHHKLHKLFNRNNIKVSYSCMDSIEKVINSHNSAILRPKTAEDENTKKCNCREPQSCPLGGECLTSCIVYKATVTSGRTEKYYYGSVEKDFKKRWSNHKTSFRLPTYEHDTSLSTYIWSLKDQGKEYNIRWEIAKKSTPYRCGGRSCTLCTEEKLFILEGDKNKMINSKSELISKCRHKGKFLLSKFDHG